MTSPRPSAALPASGRARVAVSGVFLVNGAFVATIAPRLPEIRDGLSLSNTELGFAVAFAPIGGILAGTVAGALITRFGSRRLIVAAAAASALALAAVSLAPAWAVLAVAFLAFGLADATMDVSQNAQGVQVQAQHGRSIIHSLHAFWGVGALIGGGASALAAGLRVPVPIHVATAGLVLLAVLLIVSRWMLPAPHRRADTQALAHASGRTAAHLRSLRRALVVVGGITGMAFLAGMIEDAGSTWNSIYLRDAVGVPIASAGIGYVFWAAAMVVSRLVSDRLVDRFGTVPVVQAGAVGSTVGLLVVILAPTLGGPDLGFPIAVAGFTLLGLAFGPVFPAMFLAAGRRPGIPEGEGVAIVGWLSRVGFFVAPALVGTIADLASLQVAMLMPLVGTLGVALLARSLAPEERSEAAAA